MPPSFFRMLKTIETDNRSEPNVGQQSHSILKPSAMPTSLRVSKRMFADQGLAGPDLPENAHH